MILLWLLISAVIALEIYFVIAPIMAGTYRRYRGLKTLVCPETGQIVEVKLKAGRASLMSLFDAEVARVKWCSLWPRKKGCSEECVKTYWQTPITAPPSDSHRNRIS